MNKLIGYTVITIDGVDIPLKFGAGATRAVLEEFNISLQDISSLFNYVNIEVDGVPKELPVPKDPIRFASTILWAGADYANRLNDGKGYRKIDGEEWLDELGGVGSPQIIEAYRHFFKAISNGGTPPLEDDKKKVPEK
jgi:hypothetical protein